MSVNVAADALHQAGLRVGNGSVVGTAAAAGAETGVFGSLGSGKEPHLFLARAARWAGALRA